MDTQSALPSDNRNPAPSGVSRFWMAPFRSLAVRNVIMFVVIVVALVTPIAYTYLRSVEQLLTDTLAAELAVVAQRGSTMIDAATVARLSNPNQQDSAEYLALRDTLARIQDEFEVDNAVVMRRTSLGSYAYIADGNGYFRINEHVALHDDFPDTKPAADLAFETGRLGRTSLFRSGDTRWFQVNAPLIDGGDVVGLLLINKFATPVANEIQRRQTEIIVSVAVVLAIGIALWGYFAFRFTRPLVGLRRAAGQISTGDLNIQIPTYRARNEVGDLTRTFQQMVDDLRTSRGQIEDYTHLLQIERDSFSRFVPTQFLKLLGRESAVSIQLGDSLPQSMTVMFSDIRSFTNIAESQDAENVFRFLNEYLARMEPAIQMHGGFVDKFIGDGIMALFQDEAQKKATSADFALDAAIHMRQELSEYNAQRARKGEESIRIGVGIHTGSLVLGTVGSPTRLSTTVVGDTVNLASRVEALTTHFRAGVMVTDSVLDQVTRRSDHAFREIARVRVKGKTQVVTLFDVFGWETPSSCELKEACLAEFNESLRLYRNGEFERARSAFSRVVEHNPDDRTAEAYIERCSAHLARPPEHWDGVDVFQEK